MDLKNRVAVVTGGRSGLGAATVEMLLDAGARVALLDLHVGQRQNRWHSGELLEIEADVTCEESVGRAFDSIVDNFGTTHICVNCAGIATSGKVINNGRALPLEEFTRAVSVNLIGLFDVMRRAAELMVRNNPGDDGERGVIINVSSVAATQGQRGQVAYSASKAGVIGLTLPAARDLADYGVRVTAIAPGVFRTGMFDQLPTKVTDRMEGLALYPKRSGQPDEFADLVRVIVTNRYLNAATLPLDAGIFLT